MNSEKFPSKETIDIVVIGAGISGLCAALEAAGSGASVIVLEKMRDVFEAPPPIHHPNMNYGAGPIRGNNTSRSGGGIGSYFPTPFPPETTIDEVLERANEICGNRRIHVETFRAVTERLNADMDWLFDLWVSNGVPVEGKVEYGPRPHAHPRGGGARICQALILAAEKLGVEVLFRHKAAELLTRSDGRVCGVRVMTPQGLRDFEAKAVVLASGGFEGNEEMLLKYFGPKLTYGWHLTGSPYNTGDGHLMAQKIGAKLVNMDTCHTRWVDHTPEGSNPHRRLGYWAIYVNNLGRRYVDESSGSTQTSHETALQPGGTCAMIFDENIRKLRSEYADPRIEREIIKKAETIEEVAEGIGVPYEGLRRTIDEFNAAVDGERRALHADPPKGVDRPTAHRVETPPFYFYSPLRAGLNQTCGGPLVTQKGEVLSNEDRPILGLFAAGELAFGFLSQGYHVTEAHSGLEVSTTLGRIAGKNAAEYAMMR